MKKKRLKPLFNQNALDRIFVRQKDNVSCAPACFAAIARLYELEKKKDYAFFRTALKTGKKGTSLQHIFSISHQHLPVRKMDYDGYKGGIALGFIVHKPTGSDHIVIFLAQKKDAVIYYDPYDHKIIEAHKKSLPRISGPLQDLTIKFKPLRGASFSLWRKMAILST